MNRGGAVAPEPLRNRTPPTLVKRRFFAFFVCKAVPGNASDIVRTPVFIGRGRKVRFFSGVSSRGRSPPCRQATRRPRRVSSCCASRVRMRARVRACAGALLGNTSIPRLSFFFPLPLSFDMPRGVVRSISPPLIHPFRAVISRCGRRERPAQTLGETGGFLSKRSANDPPSDPQICL